MVCPQSLNPSQGRLATGDGGGVEQRLSEAREPFEVLVERYQERLFRLVASVLGPGSAAEAEDLTQEIFLEAYRKLHTFRGASRLSTWLHRLALRRAIDRRRLARWRMPHLGEEALPEHPEDDYATPEGEVIERHRALAVRQAVDRLPEPLRTVLHLYYWMGRPVAEIAELLAIPEGTVKAQLFRARGKLRRQLGRSSQGSTQELAKP